MRLSLHACAAAALLLCGAAGAVSLYDRTSFQNLTADRKALAPGDLVTILVYENASATSTADTSLARRANTGITLERPSRTQGLSLGTRNDLDGQGRTVREGRVVAQITVTVRQVTANGDLLVAGAQSVEINNEVQRINVEGRVRRQDITEANTVLSTRLADAKISFAGDGDISQRQRPSWWQRALTWFGL